jgi:hypothetical protein
MNTLHHYIPTWLANFKANLHHFVEDAKSFANVPPTEKKKGIVVANGPSFYEADLMPLMNWNGTIVATNKPLKHLLEHGVVPDYVAALDAEEVVLQSFDHGIVREFAREMKGVFLTTTIHPKVADFCMEHFGRDKVFWNNPHFSDAIAPNICETLASITKIPTCEHGGNVGSFSYFMAIRPLCCNPIGLLGFDLSYRPNPKWSLEYAVNYRYFYNPQKNETYAMPAPFEYYLSRLLELWEFNRTLSGLTVNLTPVGPLNAVIGLQSSSLEAFTR